MTDNNNNNNQSTTTCETKFSVDDVLIMTARCVKQQFEKECNFDHQYSDEILDYNFVDENIVEVSFERSDPSIDVAPNTESTELDEIVVRFDDQHMIHVQRHVSTNNELLVTDVRKYKLLALSAVVVRPI